MGLWVIAGKFASGPDFDLNSFLVIVNWYFHFIEFQRNCSVLLNFYHFLRKILCHVKNEIDIEMFNEYFPSFLHIIMQWIIFTPNGMRTSLIFEPLKTLNSNKYLEATDVAMHVCLRVKISFRLQNGFKFAELINYKTRQSMENY